MKNTREDILDAAKALFFEKGFDATSVNDIMSALSLSKGAIYHHFDSKDAILSALIAREAEPMVAGAERIFSAEGKGILQKLREWSEFKTSFYRDRYGFLRQVFVEHDDPSLRFRILSEFKALVSPHVISAVETCGENVPNLREIVGLTLCSHELVFSYGMAEIRNEEEFSKYLDTIVSLSHKIYS